MVSIGWTACNAIVGEAVIVTAENIYDVRVAHAAVETKSFEALMLIKTAVDEMLLCSMCWHICLFKTSGARSLPNWWCELFACTQRGCA